MTRRDLTPFEGVRTELVAAEKKFPDEILIGLNRDNPQLHDVYRLSLTTGELAKEVSNPGFIGWVADSQLAVRAGIAPQPDGSFVVMIRDSTGADWRPLLTVPAADALTSGPLAFSEDGATLLAESSVGADTGRLVRFDLASGAEQVLAADPESDVAGVRLHPDTREPQLVTFLKDRLEYQVLDPALQADLDAIRALHPGDPMLADHDDSDQTWLVAFNHDTGSTAYFSYDRPSRTGAFLFEARPELSRYELAPMEPFSFTARDGLTIHGYATFPPGAGRQNLPMVLNVHGGPWARDAWGYDPEAQWLANRGYLCVQVNFRGSTGYGKAFVNAGDREWGAKMQDDLTDAVRYTTGQGWADPGRVAIYGGSYGGYAALAGAAFTPDLFRCAVDIVGPSNLKTLIETIPPYWAPMIAQFHTRVGDPAKDAEFLWSRSPLSRAHDIRVPLLIAQGATTRGSSRPSRSRSWRRSPRRESITSTCCSPTRVTGSPSRRTGSASTRPPSASWPGTWAAGPRNSTRQATLHGGPRQRAERTASWPVTPRRGRDSRNRTGHGGDQDRPGAGRYARSGPGGGPGAGRGPAGGGGRGDPAGAGRGGARGDPRGGGQFPVPELPPLVRAHPVPRGDLRVGERHDRARHPGRLPAAGR